MLKCSSRQLDNDYWLRDQYLFLALEPIKRQQDFDLIVAAVNKGMYGGESRQTTRVRSGGRKRG